MNSLRQVASERDVAHPGSIASASEYDLDATTLHQEARGE